METKKFLSLLLFSSILSLKVQGYCSRNQTVLVEELTPLGETSVENPDNLILVIYRCDYKVALNLTRNKHVNGNAPVFTMDSQKRIVMADLSLNDTSWYRSLANSGAFAVRSNLTGKSSKRYLYGSFLMNGTQVLIEPLSEDQQGSGVHHILTESEVESPFRNTDSYLPNNLADKLQPKGRTRRHSYNYYKWLEQKVGKKKKKKKKKNKQKEKYPQLRNNLFNMFGYKRQYGIELFVVIDYAIYRRWWEQVQSETLAQKRSLQYFAHVVNGVDMRFSSVQDPSFGVYVRLTGYYLAKTPGEAPWTEGIKTGEIVTSKSVVNAFKGLLLFHQWMTQYSFMFPPHDHAMLFTGYDVFAKGGDLAVDGLTFDTKICSGYSQSIVEDHGGFRCVETATHELAHVLGATSHDGEGNACSPTDQYIMAAAVEAVNDQNYQNPFRFSQCSIDQFRTFLFGLDSGGANCLSNVPVPVNFGAMQAEISQPPGQMYGPHDQCRQIYGMKSFYCAGSENDRSICRIMYCWDPVKQGCYGNLGAADGTTCGDRRWCSDGDCRFHPLAPKASSCQYGDKALGCTRPLCMISPRIVQICCSTCGP